MASRTECVPEAIADLSHALQLAARGELDAVRATLDAAPELLNCTSGGHNRTMLWEAANRKREGVVRFLLASGADANIPGRYRHETMVLVKPYVAARRKGYNAIATTLAGCTNFDIYTYAYLGKLEGITSSLADDRNLVNRRQPDETIWGITPLHHAVAGGQLAATQILVGAGAEVQAHARLLFDIACRLDRLDLIELLADAGASPGQAEAFSVLYRGNPDIADFFFTRGADVNHSTVTPMWPPIVYVSRGDKGEHPERVATLIRYGADVNARGLHGYTALHAAARAGFTQVIRVLLDAGADPNLVDDRGKTPIDLARRHRRREAVEALSH